MNRKVFVLLLSVMFLAGAGQTAVAMSENVVCNAKADNFVILFDASGSMNAKLYKGATITRLQAAKELLKQKVSVIPELGYKGGLYLYTPWSEPLIMDTFNKEAFNAAVDQLPDKTIEGTFLTKGLVNLEKQVLPNLTGKTIVYLFTDGTWTEFTGFRQPRQIAKDIANKFDICFVVICYAQKGENEALLICKDISEVNACSFKIPLREAYGHPELTTGLLYECQSAKTEAALKTVISVDNILFDFDKYNVRPEFHDALNGLGDELKANPGAKVVLSGNTDNIGSQEYNMGLSKRRAESVKAYLVKNVGIDPGTIKTQWFGKKNPVADNSTEAGRAKNRRVEVAVGE